MAQWSTSQSVSSGRSGDKWNRSSPSVSYSGSNKTEDPCSSYAPSAKMYNNNKYITYRISHWLPNPWNESHYGSSKWNFPLSHAKTVNPKKYNNPSKIAKINVTIKYLEDAEVVIPTTLTFNSCLVGVETRWIIENDYRLYSHYNHHVVIVTW